MPTFSIQSRKNLDECHKDLILICEEAIKIIDFSVICGHRDRVAQELAVTTGMSKLHWPNSKHNSLPSMAVDLLPYPSSWKDKNDNTETIWKQTKPFYFLAGVIFTIASQKNIKIRWGGDFNKDLNFSNDPFLDLPHFELIT